MKFQNSRGEVVTLVVTIIGIVAALVSVAAPVLKAKAQSYAERKAQEQAHYDVFVDNNSGGQAILFANGEPLTVSAGERGASYADSIEDGWKKTLKSVDAYVVKVDDTGKYNPNIKTRCGYSPQPFTRGNLHYAIQPDLYSPTGLRCEVRG